MSSLIVGTRGSALALTQTRHTVSEIETAVSGLAVEIRIVKTIGDRTTDASLSSFGGQGVFVREIETALLNGEIDAAVHSLKDLPVALPVGLTIAAVSRRADARDALISKKGLSLTELPRGAVIATGSPRRRAQLAAFRPDLQFADIRGNIDTRLKKLVESPDLDAIVLACAGLDRMGWGDRITERISPDICLPAVGQGALAIETRENDKRVVAVVHRIDDPDTERAVSAERAFLRHAGGGCHTPLGAWARVTGQSLTLDGMMAAPDGAWLVRDIVEGAASDAETLGARLAEKILRRSPESA
ncbi:MAG: hydroxymethylbilane synthase [candidate division Zixibacteria bacterium]|nr:hydroxymethylbilane synthase [candidate division Zixibacteria bacterium]